jgi:hypothetical protein
MTRLKNILRFVGLVDGVPASLPHNLNWNGRAVVPDFVDPSSAGYVISADATNVTITRQPGALANVDVLVESWHSIERAFGAKQTVALTPQPFVAAGGNGSSGGSFAPDRALFVAQSWPVGVDPSIYFTTIAAALAQAATMTPTDADPILISIYPGIYSDALALVSNVHLFGFTKRCVQITGAVTWTPGTGVNAPQNGNDEYLNLEFLQFLAPITIDSTTKNGAFQSRLRCLDIDIADGIACSSRISNVDNVAILDSKIATPTGGPSLASFDNTVANLLNGTYTTIALTGTATIEIDGNQIFDAVTIDTNTSNRIGAAQIFGTVGISGTAQVDFTGSWFAPGAVLTVAAGCKADVRMAEYNGNTNLAGAGKIDRTVWRTSFGPTGAGNNIVPISPPLWDANYGVSIELTAAGAYPPVSAKTNASFTINDPVGGNTYNFTITKE